MIFLCSCWYDFLSCFRSPHFSVFDLVLNPFPTWKFTCASLPSLNTPSYLKVKGVLNTHSSPFSLFHHLSVFFNYLSYFISDVQLLLFYYFHILCFQMCLCSCSLQFLRSAFTPEVIHPFLYLTSDFFVCLFFCFALVCGLWDVSSLIRDRTWALGSESAEFQLLDCRGIPWHQIYWRGRKGLVLRTSALPPLTVLKLH